MPSSDPHSSLVVSAARAGGGALAGVIRGVTALRPGQKPLHPSGTVVRGTLLRRGLEEPTGVAWLDEPGTDEVLMRWSRAIGLPAPAPDIHGLAVRVALPGREHGDLLFATTGWWAPARPLLLPGFSAQRPMTTLLPYATPQGAIVLGARPGTGVTSLFVASYFGPWRKFAELHETGGPGVDEPIRFDPVLDPLPGLRVPTWVSRLREPSYFTARRSRRSPVVVSDGSTDPLLGSGHREDPR